MSSRKVLEHVFQQTHLLRNGLLFVCHLLIRHRSLHGRKAFGSPGTQEKRDPMVPREVPQLLAARSRGVFFS